MTLLCTLTLSEQITTAFELFSTPVYDQFELFTALSCYDLYMFSYTLETYIAV